MKEKKIVVKNTSGLHARPASLLVSLAQQFQSDIFIEKAGTSVNGKSMLGVLSIAAAKDEEITIIANGCDENDAIDAIENLVLNRLIQE